MGGRYELFRGDIGTVRDPFLHSLEMASKFGGSHSQVKGCLALILLFFTRIKGQLGVQGFQKLGPPFWSHCAKASNIKILGPEEGSQFCEFLNRLGSL